MSRLRNLPVICGHRKVGLLQNIALEEKQNRIHALIVSCGLRGKRTIPVERVLAITESFILADGIEKYSKRLESQTGVLIRDTTGLLTGCLTDYALDEESLNVLAIEMSFGYLLKQNRKRIWVYRYAISENGVLIIPATLRSELSDFREGCRSCVYRP